MNSHLPIIQPEPAENADACGQHWLRSQLDREICGQSAAKDAVAVAVDLHRKRLAPANPGASALPAVHLLLMGPPGTGKTKLGTVAAAKSGLPYHVVHLCDYAAPGQTGTQWLATIKSVR
jgi:ATP-dependent protease Clp ATPase subunit